MMGINGHDHTDTLFKVDNTWFWGVNSMSNCWLGTKFVCEGRYGKEIDEKFTQIDIALEALNERKADNIVYDEDGQYVQLTANGEPIGDKIELSEVSANGIKSCEVNEDGHLVVTLSNGNTIDAGYVGNTNGVTFVPHISDDCILSWTNDGGLDNPEPVDLNPFDEWSTLPEEGIETEYEWEFI